MNARERTIRDVLHSGDQYIIPVFQRYYVWEKKNWDKLWADLQLLLNSEGSKRHFLGSIVCVPTTSEKSEKRAGDLPAYLVIDGQQRLLTISLILCALRNEAKKSNFENLANDIEENYLIHKYRNDREHFKVYPRLRDRDSYINQIAGQDPNEKNQIGAAQKYFTEKIDLLGYTDSEEELRKMFNIVTNGLEIILITLSKEDPYKIFKSLNFDGIKLGQGDLIRNHVFMKLPIDEQDAYDDKYWRPFERHFYDVDDRINSDKFSQFFKHYLMMSGKMVFDEYIYEEFDAQYPIDQLDSYDIVKKFNKNVNYMSMLEGRSTHTVQEIQRSLQAISELQITVTYPLIFSLLGLYEDTKISKDDLVLTLNAISCFIIRRQICELNSRRYIDWFVDLNGKLSGSPLKNILNYFEEKGWPNDSEFKQHFMTCQLYKMKNKKLILSKIELSLQRPTEPVDISLCDIEHVMPQTINGTTNDGKKWIAILGPRWEEIQEEWGHTIGNLTLVGNDYNKSMKAKPFEEKIGILKNSRVYLNRYFDDGGDLAHGELMKLKTVLARFQI